ncbi:MAG: hypothetical protein AAF367_12440 [Pseudomonadota bacterium]
MNAAFAKIEAAAARFGQIAETVDKALIETEIERLRSELEALKGNRLNRALDVLADEGLKAAIRTTERSIKWIIRGTVIYVFGDDLVRTLPELLKGLESRVRCRIRSGTG